MTRFNPYEEHSDAILMAASVIYRADRAGVEPDPFASRVTLLPIEDAMVIDNLDAARRQEAKVNVAARAAARLAIFQDDIEGGGVKGLFARFESRMTRILERSYVVGAMQPGGVVDKIRTGYGQTDEY